MGIRFHKTGQEIKVALNRRLAHLQQRLDQRNASLLEMMSDPTLIRSYLLRVGRSRIEQNELKPASGIIAEQIEELRKVCERVFALEREIHKLRMVATHLTDDEVFDLSYSELLSYGFELQQ